MKLLRERSFDDFMISLPSLTRKTLSVLMSYFQRRQGLSVVDSATEAAFNTGFNEEAIRGHQTDYFSNKGKFSGSRDQELWSATSSHMMVTLYFVQMN